LSRAKDGGCLLKLFSDYFDLGIAAIKTDGILKTYPAGNDENKTRTGETKVTHVKNNNTVSINPTTLQITIINHIINTVECVTPESDYEYWEALVGEYFPTL